MKKLNELYDCPYDVEIKAVKINSKQVEPGDIFVCTMGVTADRHDFIDEAIENGAAAIVVSKDVGEKSVPTIKVDNTNKELFYVAGKLYDFPQKELEMIGVTGTNGKTSVAEIIHQLLGDTCAYLGTNGKKYKNHIESIRNTTPDVDRLYMYFREFLDNGCKSLVMESSSEALYWHRLDDIPYDICILTNITEDHLNIHKTLENYIDCKARLFSLVKEDGYSILNSGSKYLDKVKEYAKGHILTYGFKGDDDLYIKSYTEGKTLDIVFVYKDKEYLVKSPLHGDFNVINIAAALLTCIVRGEKIEEILPRIENLKQIEGRFEVLDFNQDYTIILDYAHTTDAFNNILPVLNKMKKNRLITLTGSAGGREKEKRPSMGSTVLNNSDFVVFTMDDPRYENVSDIIDDLISTSKDKTNYVRINDRVEAIHYAFDHAEKGDIVLIAGKGRDDYMAIEDKYLPYCDYDEIVKYFENKKHA